MIKKILATCLVLLLTIGLFTGCVENKNHEPEVPAEKVELVISGGWTDCRAIDIVGSAFTAKYPNCTIVYEYIQDYYASIPKRMTGDDAIDIFFTTNFRSDSELLPFALDFNSNKDIDLSNTFDGLIENFELSEEGSTEKKLYVVPVGGEMRGMFVNKTLLNSLNIAVPTNQAEILAACETLKQNGYIAFHDNPGNFAQLLVYPWIANSIANASDPAAAHNKVNTREAGFSAMFREPCEFLYKLVENDYYDYKTAQGEPLNLFNNSTDEDCARYFLNIVADGDSFKKADGVGNIAFMPAPMSLCGVVDKTKDDYHSEIEYSFIPAPIGVDGGYAYLSPAHGIAVNKNSENIDWCIKFMNFLFEPENNKLFAEEFNVIPNTKEAFSYISTLYDIPDNRICEVGQASFDYGFYSLITKVLVEISKANNPKYMQEDGTMYSFDYFMEKLETSLQTRE